MAHQNANYFDISHHLPDDKEEEIKTIFYTFGLVDGGFKHCFSVLLPFAYCNITVILLTYFFNVLSEHILELS